MSYSLILAEDEETFREGILSMIDWTQLDIQIVGTAKNGKEALDLMLEHQPDILMTDIRMPFLDGLQLITKARESGLSFETIILSGYSDFDYAKQALKLQVVDYLLKPCRPDDIVRVVMELKKKLVLLEQNDKRIMELNQSINKNIPLVKNQLLTSWIYNPRLPLENRGEIIHEQQMNILPENLLLGLVRFDQLKNSQAINKNQPSDFELLRYASMNIMTETLAPLFLNKLEVFRDGEDLLWIANSNTALDAVSLKEGLVKLQFNLKSYLHVSVSIAVSSQNYHINNVHFSFKEAEHAMQKRFYKGCGNIYFAELMNKHEENRNDTILDNEQLQELENIIVAKLRNEEYESALDHTELWLDCLKNEEHYGKTEVHLRTTALIIELQKVAHERNISSFEWKHEIINWLEKTPHVDTLEELSTIIKRIIKSIVEVFSQQKPLHRTIQFALQFIHAKYNTNLTLDMVAKEAFVSNTYLSSLFKQELGVNFLDYLHQYRIEKAKELLKDNLKVFAAAKLVGYQDERHFSATFKKWTGLTPTQYQKNTGTHV